MRENVLRELASRAVLDPDFLRQARQNLESTLARHGYQLTGEEIRLVEGLLASNRWNERRGARLCAVRWPRRAYRHAASPTCRPELAWVGSG